MGMRLHAAKVYKVEYADGECFNWQVEQINDLIMEHTNNTWFSNYEYPSGAEVLEVYKNEFKELIDWLDNPENEEAYKEENEELAKVYSREEVAKNLNYLLENSDPDNDYVRLYWF